MNIIDFEEAQCKHCYKCVRHCKIKAIMVQNEKAKVIEENCILCGMCLQVCPQNAKQLISDLSLVKEWIKEGEKVAISLAPSYLTIMEHNDKEQIFSALKKLGFSYINETAEGAAMVTQDYVRLLKEGKMKNIITTCCPSVNDLVEKYYPALIPYLAPTVTPMIAHGRMLKKRYGVASKIVFLGPCIGKKKESLEKKYAGSVDAVITFEDVKGWIEQEGIDISKMPRTNSDGMNPEVNRRYPISSGIVTSVLATQDVGDTYRKFYVDGISKCIDVCEQLLHNELENCFIEMNICDDACIKGSALTNTNLSSYKAKLNLEEKVNPTPAPKEEVIKMMDTVNMSTSFENKFVKEDIPKEETIQSILRSTGKSKASDELNCGACGYKTCRDNAIAVYQNKAEANMCTPYLYNQSKSLANVVLQTSPNLVFILDEEMKILECSHTCQKQFEKSREELVNSYVYEYIDHRDFQWVYDTKQNIYGKKKYYEEYDLHTLQSIVYIDEIEALLVTMVDVTEAANVAKSNYEKNLETIDLAQKVIKKQMVVAQEIAGLLGETTAETQTTLTKLCNTLLDE